jgi:hypothetical protein
MMARTCKAQRPHDVSELVFFMVFCGIVSPAPRDNRHGETGKQSSIARGKRDLDGIYSRMWEPCAFPAFKFNVILPTHAHIENAWPRNNPPNNFPVRLAPPSAVRQSRTMEKINATRAKCDMTQSGIPLPVRGVLTHMVN